MREGNCIHKKEVMMELYESSVRTANVALVIISLLEIIMLGFTMVYADFYGEYLWRYRFFYVLLLAVASFYVFLNHYVKKNMVQRYWILNYANPLCSAFFFGWSLMVTYSDAMVNGSVDPVSFMTFSMLVPVGAYILPNVYIVIVLIADLVLSGMIFSISGVDPSLLNLLFFFIFQCVMGMSFLHIKKKLAERIVKEKYNSEVDGLTGCKNRRVYNQEMHRLSKEDIPDDFVYVVWDLNGLKEANDTCGHEMGDKLIIGMAKCLEECFLETGDIYRIGGDEFVGFVYQPKEELEKKLKECEERLKNWSKRNNTELSASYGYASYADYPDEELIDIARKADQKMYEAKGKYYKEHNKNRRQNTIE
ncbi:MAG: diguanylate cyclase [Lachnospiraceae bacterium]|nr:diguanylate cyclase [Lachnospiraceae bacterium]